MPMETFRPAFRSGNRVVRPIVFDDGTWARLGDDCLDASPLRRGTIVSSCLEHDCDEYRFHYCVAWDDGQVGTYLRHGIERAAEELLAAQEGTD